MVQGTNNITGGITNTSINNGTYVIIFFADNCIFLYNIIYFYKLSVIIYFLISYDFYYIKV